MPAEDSPPGEGGGGGGRESGFAESSILTSINRTVQNTNTALTDLSKAGNVLNV